MITDKKLTILGLSTLIFFGVGGILIIELYLDNSFAEEIKRGWNPFLQVITGIAYGLISSFICVLLINRDFFKSEKEFYADKIA